MAHFMSYLRFVIKDACFSRVLYHLRINDSIVSTKEYFISILSWQIEAVNEFTYRRPIVVRSCFPNFKCGVVYDCAFFTKTRRWLNLLNYGTDSALTREPEIASNARYYVKRKCIRSLRRKLSWRRITVTHRCYRLSPVETKWRQGVISLVPVLKDPRCKKDLSTLSRFSHAALQTNFTPNKSHTETFQLLA